MTLKDQAFFILNAAIDAVKPSILIPEKIKQNGPKVVIDKTTFDLDKYKNIYIIGAGKASAAMARELEKILTNHLNKGLVITNYGNGVKCRKCDIVEAGHPITDKRGLMASKKMALLARSFSENDLVFVLISGGASALLEIPQKGISLDDVKIVNTLLFACGADIEEINTLRKHLSQIKGGFLQKMIYPATSVTLIISDVISDAPHIIASGPTCADPSTFVDAWEVVEKYQLYEKLPVTIKNHLQAGLKINTYETPKPGDKIFNNSQNIILANNRSAQLKAASKSRELSFKTILIENPISGESKLQAVEIVRFLMQQDLSNPTAVIWGGETTVTLNGNGKGGRNQEFVLAAMQELNDSIKQPFILLSCGTDGRDGPTDAAGAWIDGQSQNRASAANLFPRDYLQNNDSYTFFKKLDRLIKTGPTGTNVMDIGIFVTPGTSNNLT
jgi:glycerate 2-kinase